MKKFFVLFFNLLFSLGIFATSIKTISFATEATYPPFESMNTDGNIIGFDIDIAKALCQQMNTECTFSNQPWNSLIPSLKIGKFDALIGAMAITPERKQQVDFTNPYYMNTASFVAEKAANLQINAASLKDKTVGVQGGTTFETYLRDTYGDNITIKAYNSIQEAFLDLVSGRVNAVLADTPIATDWLKHHASKKFVLVGKAIDDPKYFGEGDGIAVRKGNKTLITALNNALAQIKQNGTYQKIYQKYFKSQ